MAVVVAVLVMSKRVTFLPVVVVDAVAADVVAAGTDLDTTTGINPIVN